MFAKNDQISGRQVFRLFTYDLLGFSALMIPTVLARVSGTDGIFSILTGVALALAYLKLLKSVFAETKVSYGALLTEKCGNLFGGILKICYGVYFLLLSGYVAGIFTRLVLSELLREENFYLILFLILLLVFYGMAGGVEGRARIYELIFWFLMIPLFLMMLFAMGEVDVDYWTPVAVTSLKGYLTGSYSVFLCFSLIFLTLFLKEHLSDGKKLYRGGKSAVLFTGVLLAVLYLLLLGLFGKNALGEMEFPAVTMMSRVQMTGGFLKRTDAFMFGIWFFTLYALLNSVVYYGGTVVFDLFCIREKKKKMWGYFFGICLVYALACIFYHSDTAKLCYEKFLWQIGTPFVVAVPILLLLLCRMDRKRGKRAVKMMVLFLPLLVLGGCTTAEVEDKAFPVLLTVGKTEDFCKEWLNLKYSGDAVPDYNHLKVILIEKEFLEEDARMSELLEVLGNEKDVPLNTYILGTSDLEAVLEVQEHLEEPLGDYLEKLLENAPGTKKTAYPTLGLLLQEKENRMETIFIPCMGVEKEKPVITEYEVWKRGSSTGSVSDETATLSFFTSNQMKEYTLQLEQNHFIRLTNAVGRIDLIEELSNGGRIEKKAVVQLHCDGEVLYQQENLLPEENKQLLEKQLEEYFNRIAAEALERGVDVTNSRKKLGGYQRDWYFYYQNSPAFYEEDISIEYQIRVNWTNL